MGLPDQSSFGTEEKWIVHWALPPVQVKRCTLRAGSSSTPYRTQASPIPSAGVSLCIVFDSFMQLSMESSFASPSSPNSAAGPRISA